jgi:hypothetical protein
VLRVATPRGYPEEFLPAVELTGPPDSERSAERGAIESIAQRYYIVRRSLRKEAEFMKTLRLTILLVMVCTLFLLASQSAFGAIKIVKFTVPACE